MKLYAKCTLRNACSKARENNLNCCADCLAKDQCKYICVWVSGGYCYPCLQNQEVELNV